MKALSCRHSHQGYVLWYATCGAKRTEAGVVCDMVLLPKRGGRCDVTYIFRRADRCYIDQSHRPLYGIMLGSHTNILQHRTQYLFKPGLVAIYLYIDLYCGAINVGSDPWRSPYQTAYRTVIVQPVSLSYLIDQDWVEERESSREYKEQHCAVNIYLITYTSGEQWEDEDGDVTKVFDARYAKDACHAPSIHEPSQRNK